VNVSAKNVRKDHLQAAQRERPWRVKRIGLDHDIDIAAEAKTLGKDGAKYREANQANVTARGADSGKIKGKIVQTTH